MLKTTVILAAALFAVAACNTQIPSPSVAPPPTAKAGDACIGKDQKGVSFKGELGQETKGGLVCVQGGGAR